MMVLPSSLCFRLLSLFWFLVFFGGFGSSVSKLPSFVGQCLVDIDWYRLHRHD
jgi:hypothetical protein